MAGLFVLIVFLTINRINRNPYTNSSPLYRYEGNNDLPRLRQNDFHRIAW